MNSRNWGSLAVICALLAGSAALAQDKKPPELGQKAVEELKKEAGKALGQEKDAQKPAQGGAAEMDPEMMKKMMELGSPGEGHKRLEPFVGKWTFVMKWWMSPDSPAEESQGTSEFRWLYDGRYLQQEVSTPASGGMPPMKGTGLMGYNNMTKEYTNIWFDNMSTGFMIGSGKWDEKEKAIVVSGELADPMTGNLHQKWRGVHKDMGGDKHMFVMYVTGSDGKEFKNMEIVYTRAK